MLKKRILASSMASVMALSSVSVVAFADEATSKKYGETVTEKELQEYVDSLEKFADEELEQYGSKQGDQFSIAYEHAKVVIGNSKSTDVEFTAAYQMLKAVKDQLIIKTCDEVKALLKEYKSVYDENNKLNDNEEFQDLIYEEESYSEFTTAYDNALGYETSGGSRDVTDAWVGLKDAYDNLKPNKMITKAEFRKAFKDYQELDLEMKKVEPWRRGVLTVKPESGGADKNNGSLVSKKAEVDMAGLRDMVYGTSNKPYDYWKVDGSSSKWDVLPAVHVEVDEDGNETPEDRYWIGSPDLTRENPTDLQKDITIQYKKMTETSGVTKTTDKAVVAAYEACVDAVKVFEGWTTDKFSSGNKTSASNVLKSYNNELVKFNRPEVICEILGVDAIPATPYTTPSFDVTTGAGKEIKGVNFSWDPNALTLKCNKKVYFAKNAYTDKKDDASTQNVNEFVKADTRANGFLHEEEGHSIMEYIMFADADVTAGGSDVTKTEKQSVAANNDLLKYIFFCAPKATPAGSAAARDAELQAIKDEHNKLLASTVFAGAGYTGVYKLATAADAEGGQLKAATNITNLKTANKVAFTVEVAKTKAVNATKDVEFKLLTATETTANTVRDAHNAAVEEIYNAYQAVIGWDDKFETEDAYKKDLAGMKADLAQWWTDHNTNLLEEKPAAGNKTAANTDLANDATAKTTTSHTDYEGDVTLTKDYAKWLGLATDPTDQVYTFKEYTHNNGGSETLTTTQIDNHNAAVVALRPIVKALDRYFSATDGLGSLETTLTSKYTTAAGASADGSGTLKYIGIAGSVVDTTATNDLAVATTADYAEATLTEADIKYTIEYTVADNDEAAILTKLGSTGASLDLFYVINNDGTKVTASTPAAAAGTPEDKVLKHNAAIDEIKRLVGLGLTPIAATEGDYVIDSTDSGTKRNPEELAAAIEFYWTYRDYNFKDEGDKATAKSEINTLANKGSTDTADKFNTVSGANAEWTLVWRNLAYELDDMFHEPEESKYTRSDIKKLIDDAYDAMELTGDSALFTAQHTKVVDRREAAIAWLKEANYQNPWKSTDLFDFKSDNFNGGTVDVTVVHEKFKKEIDNLNKWYNGFKYSYEDIRNTIGAVAKDIDAGVVAGDEIKAQLADVSYKLATLKTSVVTAGEISAEDNAVFDESCVFQYANRLKTKKEKSSTEPSKSEKDLLKAYEKLLKTYEEAKAPAKPEVPGDVDGSGKVDAMDVAAVVSAFTSSSADLKYDVNGDGKIDAMDIAAAVDAFMKA